MSNHGLTRFFLVDRNKTRSRLTKYYACIFAFILFIAFGAFPAMAVQIPTAAKRTAVSLDSDSLSSISDNYAQWNDGPGTGFYTEKSNDYVPLYPGDLFLIYGYCKSSGFIKCRYSFYIDQFGSPHQIDSDWTAGEYYDLWRYVDTSFTKEYYAVGANNMNAHGNDQDKWKVKYINLSNDPIYLHYVGEVRWSADGQPTNATIAPCSTLEIDSKYLYPGTRANVAYTDEYPGDLVYSTLGAYTGAVALSGGNSVFQQWASGGYTVHTPQSSSGSSDSIQTKGYPLCKLGESYNCVYTTFGPPKNVATSIYSGGHRGSLRRYSSNVSDTNYGYVVFQPKSANGICGLSIDALQAYAQYNLPTAILQNPAAFQSASTQKTFKQMYPMVRPGSSMSGGVFAVSLGTNNEGIGKQIIDDSHLVVKFTGDPVISEPETIATATSTLGNNTNATQTFSSVAFQKDVSTTASSTSDHTWSNQESINATTTVTYNPPPDLGGIGASISLDIGYAHNDTQGTSVTTSKTETKSVIAPPQPVIIPPHSTAHVLWQLTGGALTQPYTFAGPIKNLKVPLKIAGRFIGIADEWFNMGSYQAFDSDITLIPFNVNDMQYVNLYDLLAPASGGQLPHGLTFDIKKNTYFMNGSGSFTANFSYQLMLQVSITDDKTNKEVCSYKTQVLPKAGKLLSTSATPC